MTPQPSSKENNWERALTILSAPPSYIKWRLYKAVTDYRRIICRNFYQERQTELERSIIVAGTARSGTTWLAEVIASQMPARIMFEPFHSEFVEEFARFNYLQYMPPDEEDAALFDIVQRILTGQIRNSWIDVQVETLRPQWRIIKEIRACLFLRWIHDRFSQVPIVFIIRHPCAVVASWIKLNWTADRDLRYLLAQPLLIENFLGDKLGMIRNARTEEERLAIIWCVTNLIPLKQFFGTPLHVVFYENLYRQPEEEIPRIFHAIGRPYKDSVFRKGRRPSLSCNIKSGIFGDANPIIAWRRVLSEDAINRVYGIVREFGLDYLYGNSEIPLQTTISP